MHAVYENQQSHVKVRSDLVDVSSGVDTVSPNVDLSIKISRQEYPRLSALVQG